MNIKRKVSIKAKVTPRFICQKGMTMLEVVVSMLVIGLGLAMSISMIQTTNRFGDSAEFSHSALEQAQGIIDSMRANRAAAGTYIFSGGASATDTYDAMYTHVADLATYKARISSLAKSCAAGVATADCNIVGARAQADMQAWSENIQALLPGGRGLIFANGRNLEVVVLWRNNPETDSNVNPVAQGIRMNFTL